MSAWVIVRSLWAFDRHTRWYGVCGWTRDSALARRFRTRSAARAVANRYLHASVEPAP